MGKKKRPYYRIVAADSRASRDGKFIESVGTYDPLASPHKVDYKEDRIIHWLSNGAQPTTTVKSLFSGKGLWLKWTLIKQGADESKISSEFAEWEKLQIEKGKRAEAKASSLAKDKVKKKAEDAKKAEEEAKASVSEAAVKVPEAETPEAPIAEVKTEEAKTAEEAVVEAVVPETEIVETVSTETKSEENAPVEAIEEPVQEEKAAEAGKEDSEKKTEG